MIFVLVYFQALIMARFSFLVFLFHANSEITENLFTVREYFAKEKFCAPTGLWQNVIVGTKWAILSRQYRSILPTQVANHNVGFNWFILPTWGACHMIIRIIARCCFVIIVVMIINKL